MELSFNHYPVFQANQVLTSRHLNDAFDYLDGQTRLTRANLIGIGIVCGLEIKLDTSAEPAILLTTGCGVTSEGYLIVEPQDLSLVAYRPYTLPDDVDYPTFKKGGKPYSMWELFEKGEPNTTPLNSPGGFLDDKAVVLFLELSKKGLRNCSPNNCDDKGSEVTVTVRRLLMQVADLDTIIAAAHNLGTGLTSSDLANALSAELHLPDVPVLRFDVLNSNPSSSEDVYFSFLNVFKRAKLAGTTGKALSAGYAAFQPLLKASYPTDPFTNFAGSFGFLDSAPQSVAQVKFLQYYMDLFEDLLRAYDEFRWKGVELICACCPPDGLFPRHLMLGLLHPEKSGQPNQYRESFRPSPAVGNCASDAKTLLQLFTRLVEMAERFTNSPGLPKANPQLFTREEMATRFTNFPSSPKANPQFVTRREETAERFTNFPRSPKTNPQTQIDPQIRITPSVLGDVPLAKKAIPYYYRENGTPPLYQLWSREKTLRNRANQNLSYRWDEYSPAAPPFVAQPLGYDLERYNFLRIEGHLGKPYDEVLRSLLLLKEQYRLPVDIIALRTGAYDDEQPVDLSQYSARFQDLEALYDALREELLSSLAEGAMDLYDDSVAGNKLPGGVPKLPLLHKYARNYRYPAGSVGAVYEEHLKLFQAIPYIDIDQTLISDPKFAQQVVTVYCKLFGGVTDVPPENRSQVVAIFYFSKLAEILLASLGSLAFAEFANRYQDLLALVRYFRNDVAKHVPEDLKTFVPQAELLDQLDEILYSCKLDAIKAVNDEYTRRVGEVKKLQFLSSFQLLHPGIQHKAGVPMGGTFILIYHGVPAISLNLPVNVIGAHVLGLGSKSASDFVKAAGPKNTAASQESKAEDINMMKTTLSTLQKRGVPPDDPAAKIIAATAGQLDNGIVIADFFLPYKISSDLPGIQFVISKIRPSVSTKIGCTNSDGNASVDITVKGGVQPYDLSVDGGAYAALSSPQVLAAGSHILTVRDAGELESTPQTITIPAAIAIGTVQYTCEQGKYTAAFSITGGTPPYTVNGKAISGNTFTTDPAKSGTAVDIEVLDSLKCSVKTSLTHDCPPPCDLPCKGIAVRRGYRFWIPEPDPQHQYKEFKLDKLVFSVEAARRKPVDLSGKLRPIITAKPADLNASFDKVVAFWLAQINKAILAAAGLHENNVSWFTLDYESLGPGRLGTLWIEYFECLSFDIRFDCIIGRTTGRDQITVTYSPKGTTINVKGDLPVTLPPYDGGKADKCNPKKPMEDLCPQPPKIKLTITKAPQQGLAVTFEVTAQPDPGDLRYLWEIPDAKPALGNGKTFAATFPDKATHPVTVTAFTKAGCSVSQTKQIPIG